MFVSLTALDESPDIAVMADSTTPGRLHIHTNRLYIGLSIREAISLHSQLTDHLTAVAVAINVETEEQNCKKPDAESLNIETKETP